MILLLDRNEKRCYKTTIEKENQQELKDIRKELIQFNNKNYVKIGNSFIEETDSRFINDPYYNAFYDFYYIPISSSSDKFFYTKNYTVEREVYKSNYQIVLRLISSILNDNPKIVDLTGIIGDFTSIDELLERRKIFRERIINTKFSSTEEFEAIKRRYNTYCYIVKCLTFVQLEKTSYKVKEKGNQNRHSQAA
jgi:hypothetical protein